MAFYIIFNRFFEIIRIIFGKIRNIFDILAGFIHYKMIAADEIISGKVGYVRSGAIERAKAWEDEKQAAILSLSNNTEEEEPGIDVVDYEEDAE